MKMKFRYEMIKQSKILLSDPENNLFLRITTNIKRRMEIGTINTDNFFAIFHKFHYKPLIEKGKRIRLIKHFDPITINYIVENLTKFSESQFTSILFLYGRNNTETGIFLEYVWFFDRLMLEIYRRIDTFTV